MLIVLLASALLGYVPNQYAGDIFKLGIAVAGAGFALFLIGYFDYESRGLRIGGPLGVFVLLMVFNPAKDVPEFLNEYLNKNFQACRENVQSQQYDVAEADYAKAAYDLPQSGTAMHWLALCQYHQERYNDAIATWKRALRLGYDPARTYYNIAFANFQLGRYEDAAKAGRSVVDGAADNIALRARAWFLIADAEFLLWDFGAGSDQNFINAKEAFQSFLEVGTPKYKAQAELACILAVKGELTTQSAEKDRYDSQAVAAFSAALSEISAYNKRNSKTERGSFADAFESKADRCGKALSELWKRKRPDESYDSLLIEVRA
ncbi:MAG: tetratricopeptide repeat protein [Methyloceanibacter sp.]|uniref:tetratricopeptide repeat protein n=1 Tax=Methyloceanibacter sp. TaxID=1965321 RepID=UPI003D6D8594